MARVDDQEILAATAEALGCRLASQELVHEGISGDGIIRAYGAELVGADGNQHSQVIYLEQSDSVEDRDGVLVFRNQETDDEVAVWLYPKDPELPALPTAVYPQAAGVILQKMGVDPAGLSLELVAYRPGKRGVVKMSTDQRTVFMKVVRPRLITELHEKYQTWEATGIPVPETLGWSDDGLIGFASLPGVAAQTVIEDLGTRFLDGIEELARRYGSVPSSGRARTSLALRRDWYERRLARRYPELAPRLSALGERISARMKSAPASPGVTVHSDLHLGQVFVDPGDPARITGVLDIDTSGVGDPADDAAALYAHMVVSSYFAVEQGHGTSDAFERLAAQWRGRWANHGENFDNRCHAIAATHLVAHALGGLVPPERLVSRAEALLSDGHGGQDEKVLI